MFTIPPIPYAGKNLSILNPKVAGYKAATLPILYPKVETGLLLISKADKCIGVPTNWISNGHISWAILYEFEAVISNFLLK